MKDLQKNKTLLVSILVFVAVIFVYNSFLKPEDAVIDTSLSTTEGAGSDVLELHSNLERVTLDKTLFSNPAYRALVDFSIVIPPKPMGRLNPFGPVGSGNKTLSASNSNKPR